MRKTSKFRTLDTNKSVSNNIRPKKRCLSILKEALNNSAENPNNIVFPEEPATQARVDEDDDVAGFSESGRDSFRAAEGNFSSKPEWNNLSECAKKGMHVKPKMGDALLFWSMRPDATFDPSGCRVIKGNKWSSTKWMHVEEYKI
ncbi:hypothetical protein L6452_02667 [Arctium lappa]|uniref:Uncharacterized protein n=1 Tax=Arctium lappa TaxID=4217 RepID=A0ACB9FK81_ARCLA|nr:hypothetical protein L6452_02667 [Arctium lappa]